MPVLTVEEMGGAPFRSDHGCGCESQHSSSSTGGKSYLPQINTCSEQSPGNVGITEAQYQCSLGVRMQPTIDSARRQVHALGFRPYQVFLVWQVRQPDRTWREYHRCELVPCKLLTMDSVEITASDWGENLVGGVALTEISPQQVDEDTLRGYIDRQDWASHSTEREFFYEIVMLRRCPNNGELQHRRRRFYQASEPFYDAESFEWSISIAQQKIERSRDGVDQTIGTVRPDGTPIPTGPQLVT